ncbi:hypothetical protein BO99DRAFT_44353 [Aspergillus violaceofuscus CBS 115571]|uniref:Uncharacterized protein n=1 Tax=Aspergillus violaceofuscus (strain CBS 115571) TaxID=1450538 RepID=A0A2V5HCK5_ASPV1|nr:hypothetical protein BO99DRAFT_44353 [Aspergillus violaceofuscus CBS 115571]
MQDPKIPYRWAFDNKRHLFKSYHSNFINVTQSAKSSRVETRRDETRANPERTNEPDLPPPPFHPLGPFFLGCVWTFAGSQCQGWLHRGRKSEGRPSDRYAARRNRIYRTHRLYTSIRRIRLSLARQRTGRNTADDIHDFFCLSYCTVRCSWCCIQACG